MGGQTAFKCISTEANGARIWMRQGTEAIAWAPGSSHTWSLYYTLQSLPLFETKKAFFLLKPPWAEGFVLFCFPLANSWPKRDSGCWGKGGQGRQKGSGEVASGARVQTCICCFHCGLGAFWQFSLLVREGIWSIFLAEERQTGLPNNPWAMGQWGGGSLPLFSMLLSLAAAPPRGHCLTGTDDREARLRFWSVLWSPTGWGANPEIQTQGLVWPSI